MLIAVGGLIASGKSSVARAIAGALDAVHIEADTIRDELLQIGAGQDAHEAAWSDNLAPGVTDRIYRELVERARGTLRSGRSAVVDGCFAYRTQREAARSVGRECRAPFLFVECRTPRPVIEERLRARSAEAGVSHEAWLVLLDRIEKRWEAASGLAAQEYLPVDASRPLPQIVAEALVLAQRPRQVAVSGTGA